MDFERLKPGSRIGDYQIISTLGSGGMGVVFLVRHVSTGVTHALKLILARRFTDRPDQLLQRFQREVEVLARIEPHPGVVRVHSYGTLDKSPWCVMEHVTGESLAQVLDRGPTPIKLAATLVAKICIALHHIHGHGVVHRDIKPPNVLIDDQGEPRLVDFGIAFDLYAESLTRTGETVGTPAFMAPEQIHRSSSSGEQAVVGPAADIYGAGAVLYSCLTGRPPFHAHSMLELLAQLTSTPPTPPREIRPEIPADLEAICLTALRKDPDARYASAMDMALDLERWLRNEPVQARVAGPIRRLWQRVAPRTRKARAAAGALAIAVVVAAWFWPVVVEVWETWGIITFRQPPPAVRLAKLEASWQDHQQLTDQELDALEDIRQTMNKDVDANLAARASLLALVATAARQPSDDSIGGKLAQLVRPNGKPSRALVIQSTKVIGPLNRPDLLDALLHRHDPVIAAPPGIATDVARFLIANAQALPLPSSRRAFNALYEAKGLACPERGQLLVRRGSARMGSGDLEAALDDFVKARQDHDVSGSPQSWPEPLIDLAQRRVTNELDSDDVRTAWTISDLLALTKGTGGSLPQDVITDAQKGALVSLAQATSAVDLDEATPHLQKTLVYGSFLERGGMTPRPVDEMPGILDMLKPQWLILGGDNEARKEISRRNPATLLLLGRLLMKSKIPGNDQKTRHKHAEASRRWLEAARACGIDERWFHLQSARLLLASNETTMAIKAARKALSQDETRPDDQRWPAIPETLARALASESRRTKNPNQLAEALRQVRKAMEIQLRVLGSQPDQPQSTQVKDWFGTGSWPQNRRRDLAKLTRDLARRVINNHEVDCCDEERWAGVSDLVTAALQLKPGSKNRAPLVSVQARHLHQDGRTDEAIQSLEVLWEQPSTWTGSDEERAALSESRKLLVRLLRSAGREAEAQDAERDLESKRKERDQRRSR